MPTETRRPLPRRLLATAPAACAIVLALAGCSSPTPAPTATVTDTSTVTVTPTTPSTPTPTSTSSADAGCLTESLSAVASDIGAGAGSLAYRIVLTNTGSSSCYLQGWPGVSFVGDGNGTQIGQPSDFYTDSPNAPVTLAANGGTAYVDVKVAESGDYSSDECQPTPVDGFRVFPPGETNSLFASASGLTGCANTDVHLLKSGAMQPGS